MCCNIISIHLFKLAFAAVEARAESGRVTTFAGYLYWYQCHRKKRALPILSLNILAALNPVASPSTPRATKSHPDPVDRPPASIISAALTASSSFTTSSPTERAQTIGSSVDAYSL